MRVAEVEKKTLQRRFISVAVKTERNSETAGLMSILLLQQRSNGTRPPPPPPRVESHADDKNDVSHSKAVCFVVVFSLIAAAQEHPSAVHFLFFFRAIRKKKTSRSRESLH